MNIEPIAVLHAWNRSHPPAYHIRSCDLEWNLNRQDRVRYQAISLAGVPALIATATDTGVALGLPRANLWLSLWGEIPSGQEVEFLKALDALRLSESRVKTVIGGDEFHFVSGVPLDGEAGSRLVSALKREGYTSAEEVADFTGDLNTVAVSNYITGAKQLAVDGGWSLDPLRIEEADELRAFLAKEFPGRWTREFDFWRDRKETSRAFWSLLRRDGETLGFARMALRSNFLPLEEGWTPGALRLPLVSESVWSANDSCLGPIGVAAAGRGQGAGRVLLGLVLEQLLANRAGRVCVDWTNAFKYYYPLHLDRARTYWTAWKASSG